MYFLGQIAAGFTIAQITADIVGMLTGTITTTAGLSAAFNTANLKLVTTVAPGYTNFDAAAGTASNGMTPVVLSAPYSDSGTLKKYIKLATLSAAQLGLQGYETWNASTHAGTNPHLAPVVSVSSYVSFVANGWVMISASPNHLLLLSYPILTFGNAPQMYFMSEYTRDDPWNVIANGYPAWFTNYNTGAAPTSTNGGMSISRLLNSTGADTVSINFGTSGGGNHARIVPYAFRFNGTDGTGAGLDNMGTYSQHQSQSEFDANKTTGYGLGPIRLMSWNSTIPIAYLFGSITAKSPYVFAFTTVWASGDEVDFGGNRYFVANIAGSTGNPIIIKEV